MLLSVSTSELDVSDDTLGQGRGTDLFEVIDSESDQLDDWSDSLLTMSRVLNNVVKA